MADRFERLFADIEAEAAAADSADLAAEVADRARSEFAELGLADRLAPAIGSVVTITVAEVDAIAGRLVEVGAAWLAVLERGREPSLVPLAAVSAVAGLPRAARAPLPASAVANRLGLRAAVRRLARDRLGVEVHYRGGREQGTIDRVGRDFFEIAAHPIGALRRAREVHGTRIFPLSSLLLLRPLSQ